MTNLDEASLYEVNQGVATITLNRPENKNALSIEMVNSIGDHFAAAQGDPGVRVILFTNNGNTFCAGADLKANQPGVTHPLLATASFRSLTTSLNRQNQF